MEHWCHCIQHPQITGPVHKEFTHLPHFWPQNVILLFYFRLCCSSGLLQVNCFPGTREVREDTLFPQTPLLIGLGSFLHQKLLLSWSSKDEVHACQDIVCAYLKQLLVHFIMLTISTSLCIYIQYIFLLFSLSQLQFLTL